MLILNRFGVKGWLRVINVETFCVFIRDLRSSNLCVSNKLLDIQIGSEMKEI